MSKNEGLIHQIAVTPIYDEWDALSAIITRDPKSKKVILYGVSELSEEDVTRLIVKNGKIPSG